MLGAKQILEILRDVPKTGRHKRLQPAKTGGKLRVPQPKDVLTKLGFTKAPDSKIKKIAKEQGIKFDDSKLGWRGDVYDQLYQELEYEEFVRLAKKYGIV